MTLRPPQWLAPLVLSLSLSLSMSLLMPMTAAQAQPAAEKVTSVEGITEYRLPNGLRLLVFPDPASATATVNITYLVGSRQEGAGEGGMAHLLEHMLFKGSPRHTNIPKELTDRGARPNGTTWLDRTNYFETFNATDDNLRWALDLEADRMVNSFVRKADLESEFSVVRSEFESGENNPNRVLFQKTMAAAYTAHSYGRPTIGNRSDVERVPIEKLQEFYRKYYQPDNAVLTVTGKVDEVKVVAMVVELFGKIPKPTRPLPVTYTVEPVQDGERYTSVRRIGDTQSLLAMYHVPDGGHPDQAPLGVLAEVWGNAPAGRLYKALVETKKATSATAFQLQGYEPGLFAIDLRMGKNDDANAVRSEAMKIVENMAQAPVTAQEVERAKTRILTETEQALRDSRQIGVSLSSYIALGDWRLVFLERDRVRAVKPEDVQRVALTYFKPTNRTLGQFFPDAAPDRAVIPAQSDLAVALKGYKGDPVMAQGEAFDPSPANIESRVQRYKLPAGMKVALLPKKTRGASVQAVISLHFGSIDELKGLSETGDMTAALLKRGTAKRTRQQLQDELDRLKAQMNVGGGPSGATVSIETTRENLPAVLKLAGEVLREPAFPESEFEQIRKQQLSGIDARRSDPQALSGNRLNRALYSFPRGDVRETPTLDEEAQDIQALKLAELKRFHERFYGASNAELAIVGDFDVAAARAVIDPLFGNWKSPSRYEQIRNGFQPGQAINESIETPDKANAVFIAAQRLPVRDTDPAYPALLLGNQMLGGGFLNSRLASRIRVKDGLSYGAGSSLSASTAEPDGRFQAYAIAAPQNVAKVEVAFREEMARALADGFTKAEVDAGRDGWLQSRQVSRSSDAALAGLLAARDRYDRTLAFDAAIDDGVRQLTPESVAAALRAQLDVSKMTIVKAGDFRKPAP